MLKLLQLLKNKDKTEEQQIKPEELKSSKELNNIMMNIIKEFFKKLMPRD